MSVESPLQIYDYKEKRARVVFGPELVMLGPDEQFTLLSLSGGKPKRPNEIKSLCLLLGPVRESTPVSRACRNWISNCINRRENKIFPSCLKSSLIALCCCALHF